MKEMNERFDVIETKLNEIIARLAVLELGGGNKTVSEPPPNVPKKATPAGIEPQCKFCGGPMFDNSQTKRNPKAPDYRCRNKDCNYVAWRRTNGELSWKKSTF